MNVDVKRNAPQIFFQVPQSCFDSLDSWNIFISGLSRALSGVIWLAAARLAPEGAMCFLAGGGGGGGVRRRRTSEALPPPQGARRIC